MLNREGSEINTCGREGKEMGWEERGDPSPRPRTSVAPRGAVKWEQPFRVILSWLGWLGGVLGFSLLLVVTEQSPDMGSPERGGGWRV